MIVKARTDVKTRIDEPRASDVKKAYPYPGGLPPMTDRAGSPIDPLWREPVSTIMRGSHLVIGSLDTKARIFQSAGDPKNFVYWKERAITLPRDAWSFLKGRADYIEIVDKGRNICYRVAYAKAIRFAFFYQSAGIGIRVAVPLDCFDVVDHQWNYVAEATK